MWPTYIYLDVYLSYGCNSLGEGGSQLVFHSLLLSSCCLML